MLANLLAQVGTVLCSPGSCSFGSNDLLLSLLLSNRRLRLLFQQCRPQCGLAALAGSITFVGHPGSLVMLWIRRVITRLRNGCQVAQQQQCNRNESKVHTDIVGRQDGLSQPSFVTICQLKLAPLAKDSRAAQNRGCYKLSTPMQNPVSRANKILVVDDDARIRDLLKRYLTQEGFDVLLAEDGKSLSRVMLRDTADLIVLDLMMPGEDGLSICRRLRAANDHTPIIMLTAKGEDIDRIVGLEVGADDYLSKPFNPRELLARIHAVLRRRPTPEVPGAPSSDNEIARFGTFTFDLAARTLYKGDEELTLTTGEFAMLKALVRHPRIPLSREKLAQLSRGREFEPFDRSLDVQVSRLRKLIETDPASPRLIQTVWGVGYVFVPDEVV